VNVDYRPDFPVTDESCRAATGRSLADWFAFIDAAGLSDKRRDAIQAVYNETGRGKDVWWPTTIWVEMEKARGIVQKDGRPEGFNICCTKSFKQSPAELFPHFATDGAFGSWVPGWSGAIEEGTTFRCGEATGTVGRVRPAKDIRMKWVSPGRAPTDIEIQFAVMGGKTTINFYHKRIDSRDEADGLRRAWGEALDRLKTKVG
jgi:hypothetical protein